MIKTLAPLSKGQEKVLKAIVKEKEFLGYTVIGKKLNQHRAVVWGAVSSLVKKGYLKKTKKGVISLK